MKRMAMTAIVGLGTMAWGWAERSVTVCLDGVKEKQIASSTQMASAILVGAGVEIQWRDVSDCPRSQDVIKVMFSFQAGEEIHPQAFAYARPFEGTTIQVFYNRINKAAPGWLPKLLAYVLVHEITHILQGTDSHSTQGIMKGKWGTEEYLAIWKGELHFAESDVDLIHIGLNARERWAAKRTAELATR